MEGIVAKQKFGAYVTEREHSTWFKILNREYSQKSGIFTERWQRGIIWCGLRGSERVERVNNAAGVKFL
ncbi:MAG: hypothetical protein DMG96_12185 [Acidobacteria bacterium]|nr:MAG: hypothetical protein DMG96_12185 [Acidobacteriota bacterium]